MENIRYSEIHAITNLLEQHRKEIVPRLNLLNNLVNEMIENTELPKEKQDKLKEKLIVQKDQLSNVTEEYLLKSINVLSGAALNQTQFMRLLRGFLRGCRNEGSSYEKWGKKVVKQFGLSDRVIEDKVQTFLY